MAKNMINPSSFFAIVAAIILLITSLQTSDARTPKNSENSIFSPIKNFFFPRIEVTLSNEGDHDVLYMCNLTKNNTGLYLLRKGEKFSYNFIQVAFPLRWCYLYINDKMNGFFWSYNVRLRCTKCFWSINKFPYLYRSDRTRWERQTLFKPRNFYVDNFKKKAPPPPPSNDGS